MDKKDCIIYNYILYNYSAIIKKEILPFMTIKMGLEEAMFMR